MEEINFLKVLRNGIANGETITEQEIDRVVSVTSDAFEGLTTEGDSAWPVLILSTQILANVSVRLSSQRGLYWKAFYPNLVRLLASTGNPRVLEPLCYALWHFAVDRTYTLSGDGLAILQRLIDFYGECQDCGNMTTMTLLLDRVLQQYPDWDFKRTDLLTIGKADVDCFSDELVVKILQRLFDLAKYDDSYEVLFALRNCVTMKTSDSSELSSITDWTLNRLSAVRSTAHERTGHQTDLIALLCNLIFQRKEIQDRVMDRNGMQLIMNGIRLDERNPLIREWSLFFIRNMCLENTRAQAFVKSLELQQTVVDSSLGLEIERTAAGKFSVRKKQQT